MAIDTTGRLVGGVAGSGRLTGIACGMISLGCAKNLVDSETMLGLLRAEGADIITDPAEADVIIVNTCGFVTDAKQESINSILEMGEHKETGKCRALIVAGCLSQRHGDELDESIPEADAFIGVGQVPAIADIVLGALEGARIKRLEANDYQYDFPLPRMLSTGSASAYLKVSEGCSNRCTYCAIPVIRGPHRSRPMESIVAEARALAESGVRELNLIAQDTSGYGEDLYGKPALAELLARLSDVPDIPWIRVLYMYPNRITDSLLETMASDPRICPYFDIPLQHADPAVLRDMNRKGSPGEILALVGRIRGILPGAAIRTTFIVGFPGETDARFATLRDTLLRAEFDRVGVFAYSREEGTPAYGFADQVPDDVKEARKDELMSLQQGISLKANKARLGSLARVLVESGVPGKPGLWVGRSRLEAPDVDGKIILGDAGLPVAVGGFVDVRLKEALPYDIRGVAEAVPNGPENR